MSVINTLRERIELYEEPTKLKLMRRLPVITVVNGRSFKKATSLLQKPFAPEFMELMCGTMVKLATEIDGTTIGYSFNDEIIIISRNDQSNDTEAYYNNKVQKIVSAAASIATLELNRLARQNDVQLFGDPIFTAKTFVVPNIPEAINLLIHAQQRAFHNALHNASFYELLKKHDIETVQKTLENRSAQEKAEILFNETNTDFNNYPLPFRRGVATYRQPQLVASDLGEAIKYKLIINMEIPLFTKEHEFLGDIFSGRGIIRAK